MDKSPKATEFARHLRKSQTDAERKLWGYLRDRRLGGLKFRRQYPVPPYIADFCCLERMFIVEADGATHSSGAELAHDRVRSRFLISKDFTLHRVNNAEIYRNPTEVLDGILLAIEQLKSL